MVISPREVPLSMNEVAIYAAATAALAVAINLALVKTARRYRLWRGRHATRWIPDIHGTEPPQRSSPLGGPDTCR